MANTVRQYVGARYVPKFADPVAWQSGTSYEALTIVTYNNASYTSKIPVPATVGNPADNDTYWVLTGNYNAQVEAYREETVAVQENLDETNQNLTNEIQAREDADNDLTTLIGYHNNANRTIICIGDSYAEGYSPDGTTTSWEQQIARIGRFKNIYNLYVGGAGFVNGTTFLQQLQNADTTITDKNSITDILVGGGYNDDGHTESEIETAVSAFATYVRETYPNATIWIAFIGGTVDGKSTNTTRLENAQYNTFIRYYTSSLQYRCNFIPQAATWAYYDMFSTDFVHPNNNGQFLIALLMLSGLNYNSYVYPRYTQHSVHIKYDENINNGQETTLGSIACYFGQWRYNINEVFSFVPVSAVNMEFNNNFSLTIGTYYSNIIAGEHSFLDIPIVAMIHGTHGGSLGYYNIPCHLHVANHVLSLRGVLGSGGGYYSITGVDNIQISPISVTIDRFT